MLTVGGLFSGIGGWELGLQRAGMHIAWHCESDPYCQRVLRHYWLTVPCYPDIRQLGQGRQWVPAGVDVLCGGFPCQDISFAGRGAGLAGERSGLWREFARLIGELRPRYVLVENVPALTSRGLDVVLADLAACGFDAEWDHLPASAFGAPHRRDRIWLVAYPNADGGGQPQRGERNGRQAEPGLAASQRHDAGRLHTDVADADDQGLEGHGRPVMRAGERAVGTDGAGSGGLHGYSGHWLAEPDVGRVAHGIPARVDRLRALGNALVPQIAEWIGRRIIDWELTNAR